MFAEAAESAAAVGAQRRSQAEYDALAARLRGMAPRIAFTCARGSSDHAATYAKFMIETRLGVPVVSHSPSLVSMYGSDLAFARDALFLVISQSGRSPDLLLSAEAAKRSGALVVALVNDQNSPLAQLADIAVPLRAGAETSVAATKSYIASLTAVARLTACWAGDDAVLGAVDALPAALEVAWATDWSAALPDLLGARGALVLGRGSTFGIAQEAALKFKETCGLHAEAFSSAEVAHGPMELVVEEFPVLVFAPADAGATGLDDLLARFVARGARVSVAGRRVEGCRVLEVSSGLHPSLAPIAAVQSFYRLVNALSVARGRDPDRPAMLGKVTRTT
ncbi:MAG TPA: SIS domain-containing protein [Sphingomonadaceae bacterium]|nr:SIS domain-containing protein [Sphingomonadaceae bacterium]